MPPEIAVQSKTCALHTVISKDDFSKLTVVRVKALDNTATFTISHRLDDSRIGKNQLKRLQFVQEGTQKQQ